MKEQTFWKWALTKWYSYVIFLSLYLGIPFYNYGVVFNPLTAEAVGYLIGALILTFIIISIIFIKK